MSSTSIILSYRWMKRLFVAAAFLLFILFSNYQIIIVQQHQLLLQQQQQPTNNNKIHEQYIHRNKRGRVVMRGFRKISLQDLPDITDDSIISQLSSSSTASQKGNNKHLIIQRLKEMGIDHVDSQVQNMLPTWEEVTQLYGHHPVVFGTDSCRNFRNKMPPRERYIGVAGIFNTGTNALTYYMRANLVMPQNNREQFQGILSQVPWNKHSFFQDRHTEFARVHQNISKSNVLPVVIIRDPFTWAQSMCQSPYEVQYRGDLPPHCPSLTGNSSVMYKQIQFPTLMHLWNEYYRQYITTDLPRIIVRFEDLLFHPKKVIDAIKTCSAAKWKDNAKFFFVTDHSKWEHVRELGPQSNLVSAIIKHSNARRRVRNMTREDLEAAPAILDKNILRIFNYHLPEIPL